MKKYISVFYLVVFGFFNSSVLAQETTINNGETIPTVPWKVFGPTIDDQHHFPILWVRVSVHVIQDNSGGNNFTSASSDAQVKEYIDSINLKLSNYSGAKLGI